MAVNIFEVAGEGLKRASKSYQEKTRKVSPMERDLGAKVVDVKSEPVTLKIKEHVPITAPVNGNYSFSFKKGAEVKSAPKANSVKEETKAQSTPKEESVVSKNFNKLKDLEVREMMENLYSLRTSLSEEDFKSLTERLVKHHVEKAANDELNKMKKAGEEIKRKHQAAEKAKDITPKSDRREVLLNVFEGIKNLEGISIMQSLTGLKESGKLTAEEYESILEQVKVYKDSNVKESKPEAAADSKKFIPYTKDEFINVINHLLIKAIGKGKLGLSILDEFKNIDFIAPSTLAETNEYMVKLIKSKQNAIDEIIDKAGFKHIPLCGHLEIAITKGIGNLKRIKLEKKEFDINQCATEVAQTVALGFEYDPKLEDLKTAIFDMVTNSGVTDKTQAVSLLNSGLFDIKFELGIEDINLMDVYLKADKGEREFVYIPAPMSNDDMYEALQGIQEQEAASKIVTVKRKGRNTRK